MTKNRIQLITNSSLLFVVTILWLSGWNTSHSFTGDTLFASSSTATAPRVDTISNKDARYETYCNASCGLTLEYPRNWTKSEVNKQFSSIVFRYPEGNSLSRINVGLNITVKNLEFPISLEEYSKQNMEQLKQNMKDMKILEKSDVLLSNYPAEKLVLSGQYQQSEFQCLQLWSIKDKKLYTLTFTSPQVQYQYFLPQVQRMIDSIQLK